MLLLIISRKNDDILVNNKSKIIEIYTVLIVINIIKYTIFVVLESTNIGAK